MTAGTASGPAETGWDYEHRPRRMRVVAILAAVAVLALHVVWALTLRNGDTGVTLGAADQMSFVIIGLIFSGLILTLLRIRVRAGRDGVEVRGPLRDRRWPWEDVVGFTFPRSGQFPRLELPAYEYVGIWAIQAIDGESGIDAMDRLREVAARYKPSAADPESVADR